MDAKDERIAQLESGLDQFSAENERLVSENRRLKRELEAIQRMTPVLGKKKAAIIAGMATIIAERQKAEDALEVHRWIMEKFFSGDAIKDANTLLSKSPHTSDMPPLSAK